MSADIKPHMLYLGFGASARALQLHLARAGWQCSATCRDKEKQAELEAQNINAILLAENEDEGKSEFVLAEDITHVLVSAPPSEKGDVFVERFVWRDVLPRLQWLGYLSTTAVYGDHQGGWVDEETPLRAKSARAVRRVEAEAAWQRAVAPTHIFRLAGIYGAHSNALRRLKAGKARRINKAGQVFSRIHVEDIAQVLWASINAPHKSARIYNVCDDLPAPPQDVIAYAAELLGAPVPPLVPIEEVELSEMARSFYDDNRRVKNNRIKQELGVSLKYADYKMGLRALYEQGGF